MRSPQTARQVLDKVGREHPELMLAAKDVDMSLVAMLLEMRLLERIAWSRNTAVALARFERVREK